MLKTKRGSIFLLALTVMTVLFILGFSITYFTGSEEYSSAMSYESEVAFNLAESAVEEFLARLKNSLNHDDNGNQLYKVLRSATVDVSKEIPLDASQVANLTAYTRDTARQIYGIQFGRGLADSKDFVVEAVLRLKHIDGVGDENSVYAIKKDTKEKQGELAVTATVNYKGHEAKVSLTFLIRVVKTFVPPFNYFTLFVRDGSISGGSNFNTFESAITQGTSLRLDHGWNAIMRDFNPTVNPSEWEKALAQLREKALTPPGRVYIGQDLETLLKTGPGIVIRSTNGAKLLYGENLDPNVEKFTQMNAQENMYLKFDVPWCGMKDYVKKYMKLQGQDKTKEGWLFTGWGNDNKLRVFNVGSGKELTETTIGGAPSFINCFQSYLVHTQKMVKDVANETEKEMMRRFFPELSLSGFHPLGAAPPTDALQPLGRADFSKLSPTLVYGPAQRQYFRAVQYKSKNGKEVELPFVDDTYFAMILDKDGKPLSDDKEMTASQAETLFLNAGVDADHVQRLVEVWDDMPDGLHEFAKYKNFMSNSGAESFNIGLANFLNRLNDKKEEYDGPLKDFLGGPLESYPYPYGNIPSGMDAVVGGCPVREFCEGPLAYALPSADENVMFDFYFLPRSTEDFFRGRTTVAIGGISYDRFEYKYINNVQSYRSGANNQTLELNGILTLNDSEVLGLRNLKFRGHGVIFSSPMMGGGKVVIAGDLLGVDTDENNIESSIAQNMLTIVAPQIVIDTKYAQGGRCYVEANLMSLAEPLQVIGDKPITIKGTVVTPRLNLEESFQPRGENVIIYNAMNGIWRNAMPNLMDSMYVAKIVTGGVGKFDWKYER